MIVRKAHIEDIDQLVILFDQYRVFYDKESDVTRGRIFLSERIARNDAEIFVAESADGVLAGFVQLYPIFSSTRMKRLWLLNDLFVSSTFRGQHISLVLIERAKQLAAETHAAGLLLETNKSNVASNSLYIRTDFTLDSDHNYYTWNL